MPHYKNGIEAKRGDVVKGKGYNVPHEIQGILVGVEPGADTCNVRVAWLKPVQVGDSIVPTVDIEYGQADAFEKVA